MQKQSETMRRFIDICTGGRGRAKCPVDGLREARRSLTKAAFVAAASRWEPRRPRGREGREWRSGGAPAEEEEVRRSLPRPPTCGSACV